MHADGDLWSLAQQFIRIANLENPPWPVALIFNDHATKNSIGSAGAMDED